MTGLSIRDKKTGLNKVSVLEFAGKRIQTWGHVNDAMITNVARRRYGYVGDVNVTHALSKSGRDPSDFQIVAQFVAETHQDCTVATLK